jgi:hypothetical protein
VLFFAVRLRSIRDESLAVGAPAPWRARRLLYFQRERDVGLVVGSAQEVRHPCEPRVATDLLPLGGVVDDPGERRLFVEADAARCSVPLRTGRGRGGNDQRGDDKHAVHHGVPSRTLR